MVNADAATGAKDKCVFNGIAQLTDIARPRVGSDFLDGFGRHSQDFFSTLLVVQTNEILHDNGYIFKPVFERWAVDGEDVNAEIEVIPKLILLDQRFQVFVCG